MTPRQQTILDAAITVLGSGGSRALTHRAVDEAAGLPTGSTSNYFRSREALVEGIVERLVQHDVDQWSDSPTPAPANGAELARMLAHLVLAATTTDRIRSQARYALFVEGMVAGPDSMIVTAIRRSRDRLTGFCHEILTSLAAPEPKRATRILVDYLDGMIIHQLTGSTTSPAVVRRDIAGFVDRLIP